MNAGILGRTIENLDTILAIAGSFVAVALIALTPVVDNPQYALVGVILLLACIAYLSIGRRSGLPDAPQPTGTRSLHLLLNIIFFSALLSSILSLYLRPDPHVRPLSYFLSMVIMAGTLAAEILFLPRSKPYSYYMLAKIAVIPLGLAWSQLLLFPTVIIDDAFWHQWFTQNMLDSGYLTGGSGYARLPVTHLFTGATSLVTGLGYKAAAIFSVISVNIIGLLLFTFLLGRFIFNARVGLLAALLLAFSVDLVGMSRLIMPNTFAAFMIPAITYVIFRLKAHQSAVATSLAILIMLTLILTHTIVSVCVAVLLFAFWAGFAVYNRAYKKQGTAVTFGITILFSAAMLGWWTFASGHLNSLVNLATWGFDLDYWIQSTPAYGEIAQSVQYTHPVPVAESLFNSIGRYLFIGIALPGCFYALSRRASHPYAFSFTAGAMAIAGMTFAASVFEYGIQTGRWHYFVQILLAVPFAVTLLWFSARIRSEAGKTLSMGALAAALAFLMIMTPTANLDNPLFKNMVVRKAYTESELQATDTILRLTDRNMATDAGSVGHFAFLPQFPTDRMSAIGKSFFSKDFADYRNSVVMIRRELSQGTFTLGVDSYTKLPYDPAEFLAEEGFSRVYQSGDSVGAFYWTSRPPPLPAEP